MNKSISFKPQTLEQALTLLKKYGEEAVIINGGTDITPKIVANLIKSNVIIYIQDIPEMKNIYKDEKLIIIGGSATYSDIQISPLCQRYNGLIEAIKVLGSPAIRNTATPAGNICTAAPAGDCNVILLALDARATLASIAGERTLCMKDLFLAPYNTVLKKDELIKEIKIPIPEPNTASSFIKLARRKSQDISRVAVAIYLKTDGAIFQDIRIAIGAINTIPFRSIALENMLLGEKIDDGLRKIKDVFPPEAKPRTNYKRMVTNIIIERAIKNAQAMVMGGEIIG